MKAYREPNAFRSYFLPRQRLCSDVFFFLAAVFLTMASGCGGSSNPPAVPVISSFTAANSSITSGDSTTLNWTVSNAASLTINGTTVTGTSDTVHPTVTTTYTLTATNTTGKSATAQVTVTVVGAPSIASFTAAANPIGAGSSTTLNWTASNATSFSINGTAVSGTSYPVSPTSTTTYTLAASNSLGASVTAEITVHVVPGISSFTSSASSVSLGGSGATLSWSALDATSLSIAATPTGGTTTITNVTGATSLHVYPTAATSYVLTAGNSEGNSTSPTIQITTTAALNDITGFLASPAASTSSGVSVTLTPTFIGGDTAIVTDDQGNTVQSPAISGTGVAVTPSKTTTYTLTVTNPTTNPPATEIRNLRVVIGDISDFSGIGNPQYGNSYQFLPGTATTAQFFLPYSLTPDSAGNVYFNDAQACVVAKLDNIGDATEVAGIANNCGSADGDALTVAQFGPFMSGIAFTSDGNIYVGDQANNEIREISDGQVSTPAGSPTNTTDIDGTGSGAGFAAFSIMDVALDSLGELIVAESGAIRVMDSGGTVTTLAGVTGSSILTDGTGRTGNGTNTARFIFVAGIAIDTSTDTIYITDDNTVRTMTPNKSSGTSAATWTWTVTTWVNLSDTNGYLDGSAATAELNLPSGIARASDGTLFVADYGNYIRRITPAGVVDTVAGNGSSCDLIDPPFMCTLPNTTNTAPEPLPGVTYSPLKITVDPSSDRLFFDVYDVTSVFTMPY